MQKNDSLVELLERANGGSVDAGRELLRQLWVLYFPIAYSQMKRKCPTKGSDLVASGFRCFAEDLSAGRIRATDRRHLIGIVRRKIYDRLYDETLKDQRRSSILSVRSEADLLAGDFPEGSSGIEEWGVARSDPIPELERLLHDLFNVIEDANLRTVLCSKLDISSDTSRSNRSVARELGLTPKEVESRLKQIRHQLQQECAWIHELTEGRASREASGDSKNAE